VTGPAASAPASAAAGTEPRSGPPPEVPADWPNRALGRQVRAGGYAWHVQVSPPPRPDAPVLLLLHGSGASAHSWAGLLPVLALEAGVVAPDLPGHGFTRGGEGEKLSLAHVAQALQALLGELEVRPALVAGHSAGAALALRWALLDEPAAGAAAEAPTGAAPGGAAPSIVGFAPSLVPPAAVYTNLLGPLLTPLLTAGPVAWLTAAWSGPLGLVDRLLDSTGSNLGPVGRARYATLFRDPAHVQGVLSFMAAADLPGLLAEARPLAPRCRFVLGERDAWVPQAALTEVLDRRLPGAERLLWPEGHLMHEERPEDASGLMLETLRQGGALRSTP
jgi:magnesium chelatase accessory protein